MNLKDIIQHEGAMIKKFCEKKMFEVRKNWDKKYCVEKAVW